MSIIKNKGKQISIGEGKDAYELPAGVVALHPNRMKTFQDALKKDKTLQDLVKAGTLVLVDEKKPAAAPAADAQASAPAPTPAAAPGGK